jgi:HK97 gp10 family phage protein
MGYTVDVSQLLGLAADLSAAAAGIETGAVIVLAKTVFDIEADAKSLAPVRTGNLRNSINSDVNGLTGEVGPTADYGGYVEYGTWKMSPQPYMGPALDRNLSGFEDALLSLVSDVI